MNLDFWMFVRIIYTLYDCHHLYNSRPMFLYQQTEKHEAFNFCVFFVFFLFLCSKFGFDVCECSIGRSIKINYLQCLYLRAFHLIALCNGSVRVCGWKFIWEKQNAECEVFVINLDMLKVNWEKLRERSIQCEWFFFLWDERGCLHYKWFSDINHFSISLRFTFYSISVRYLYTYTLSFFFFFKGTISQLVNTESKYFIGWFTILFDFFFLFCQ